MQLTLEEAVRVLREYEEAFQKSLDHAFDRNPDADGVPLTSSLIAARTKAQRFLGEYDAGKA